jgi:hypothetical protein
MRGESSHGLADLVCFLRECMHQILGSRKMANNVCDIRISPFSGLSVESRPSENIRGPILEACMYTLCCLGCADCCHSACQFLVWCGLPNHLVGEEPIATCPDLVSKVDCHDRAFLASAPLFWLRVSWAALLFLVDKPSPLLLSGRLDLLCCRPIC